MDGAEKLYNFAAEISHIYNVISKRQEYEESKNFYFVSAVSTFSQVKAMRAPKAQDIPVYKKGPHMGTRTIEPRVIVSLDDSNLAVTISKYDGEVKVVVIDDADCVAANKIFVVEGSTSEELELSGLKHGFYSISIELDKVVYCGVIDI